MTHDLCGSELSCKLMCTADGDNSTEFLGKWLKKNRKWVHEQLVLFGAVKFSGFSVKDPQGVRELHWSAPLRAASNFRATPG